MKRVKLKEHEMQIPLSQIEFFHSFPMTQLLIPGRILVSNHPSTTNQRMRLQCLYLVLHCSAEQSTNVP